MGSSRLTPTLPVTLPRHQIDPDALFVVRRLQEAGFFTCLVGGCVRDILLGRRPKDFDVGTEATPNQVKRVFRNCRLIGRRFRLAHIHFGAKIIEVATFRGGAGEGAEASPDQLGLPADALERLAPQRLPEPLAGDDDMVGVEDEATDDADGAADDADGAEGDTEGDTEGDDAKLVSDDLLVVRANNFGTPEQDAQSRDFTVNGLFYDPIAERVIDHVNGYEDLRHGIIRTIGPAEQRFREDPVRILRAVKFAARLGFHVEDEAWRAMRTVAPDILKCPIPRVTEELYRIAECTHATRAFEVMADAGVLEVVLPEVAEFRAEQREIYDGHLATIDRLGLAHGGLPRDFLVTTIYYPLALRVVAVAELTPGPSWGVAVDEWFRPIGVRMHVPIRHRQRMRSVLSTLGRMMAPGSTKRRIRLSTGERAALPQALTLLRMHERQGLVPRETYERWRELGVELGMSWVPNGAGEVPEFDDDGSDAPPPGAQRPRGRRRRGRNRGQSAP